MSSLEEFYIAPYITAIGSEFLSDKNTGLGNVMFQISSVLGLSKLTGKKCNFNRVLEYGKKLKEKYNFDHLYVFFKKINLEEKEINFYKLDLQDAYKYDTELIKFCTEFKGNLIISGYMENEKYFSDIEKYIFDIFSPDENFITTMKIKYDEYFSKMNPISIHFRGNEYFKIRGKNYDYDFYKNAVEYAKQRIKNPVFFIFSDDINSINLEIFNDVDKVIINEKYDYEALWLMSLCCINILSFSTFSWWGAYLNKNRFALCDKRERKFFDFAISI